MEEFSLLIEDSTERPQIDLQNKSTDEQGSVVL